MVPAFSELGLSPELLAAVGAGRFAFVEVPRQYVDQVLDRMQRVRIRSRPVTVKRATPSGGGRSRRPAHKAGIRRKAPRRHDAA